MPRYLYTLTATRADMVASGMTAAELEAFEAHGAHLERLAADGVVLLVARAMDAGGDGFGLAIVEAPDDDAARALAAADPFVARGVARAQVYPFHLSYLAPALTAAAGAMDAR